MAKPSAANPTRHGLVRRWVLMLLGFVMLGVLQSALVLQFSSAHRYFDGLREALVAAHCDEAPCPTLSAIPTPPPAIDWLEPHLPPSDWREVWADARGPQRDAATAKHALQLATRALDKRAHAVTDALLAACIVVPLLCTFVLVSWGLLHLARMRRLLKEVRQGALALSDAQLDYRIAVVTQDELGEVAEQINALIDARQTAERELAKAEDFQGKVLAHSSEAIFALDADGKITMANPALHALAHVGDGAHALIGQRFADWLPESARAEWQQHLSVMRLNPHALRRWPIRRNFDDHSQQLLLSVAPMGSVKHGFVGTIEDVTEATNAHNRLREHAELLQRSNRELEQFAYVASHDLQEPLRSISSFSQLLARRYKGQLGEEADEYIQFIASSVLRMRSLLEDLLAFSKVAGGSQNLEPVAFGDCLQSALANLRAAMDESGALVTRDTLPEVYGNSGLLKQLLQNLIGNAIKFKGSATPVVHISATRQGAMWEFAVSDNGIGIPAESRERVFVLFQRLHTLDHYQGNGIGLTLCKKIVEVHGGRIWVGDNPDAAGTRICFTLPAEAPAQL